MFSAPLSLDSLISFEAHNASISSTTVRGDGISVQPAVNDVLGITLDIFCEKVALLVCCRWVGWWQPHAGMIAVAPVLFRAGIVIVTVSTYTWLVPDVFCVLF